MIGAIRPDAVGGSLLAGGWSEILPIGSQSFLATAPHWQLASLPETFACRGEAERVWDPLDVLERRG